MIYKLLNYVIENNCSDLHIIYNELPYIRKNKIISPLSDFPKLTNNIINNIIEELLYTKQLDCNEKQLKNNKDIFNKKLNELYSNRQIDLPFQLINQYRFRVNIFSQKNHFSIVIRKINNIIPSLNDLGLPSVIKSFVNYSDGLILVTGPTGSGKSTTLASIIDIINSNQKKHILTIEDPIEYVHNNKSCIINQRELGIDFNSYNDAIKSALREDPDIVLVGEMRDLDTISNTIRIAETGHLVFATLHTISAPYSIDRIIDVFPSNQQQQIRIQLSSVLRAIISQKLIPNLNNSISCATEIMIVNNAIKGIIREGTQINTIKDQMIINKNLLGSQTLEQSLLSLIQQNIISVDMALKYSNDLESFKRFISNF